MNARRPLSRPSQTRKPRRPSDRRETRPAERRSARFETRRTVVVPGHRGQQQFSLRALVVGFFVLIAIIGVTPTLSKYLEQRQNLRDLTSELASVQKHNDELQKELDLWNDDEYVKTQARERLGYVLPGQTLYVVTDPSKGTAQEQLQAKVDSVNRERRAVTPWFATLWDSVVVAGNSGGEDNPNNVPILKDSKND